MAKSLRQWFAMSTVERVEAMLEQIREESDRLSPDATPTGIGDPLADVLRNIDNLLTPPKRNSSRAR